MEVFLYITDVTFNDKVEIGGLLAFDVVDGEYRGLGGAGFEDDVGAGFSDDEVCSVEIVVDLVGVSDDMWCDVGGEGYLL